jgi:hypothetical protein
VQETRGALVTATVTVHGPAERVRDFEHVFGPTTVPVVLLERGLPILAEGVTFMTDSLDAIL